MTEEQKQPNEDAAVEGKPDAVITIRITPEERITVTSNITSSSIVAAILYSALREIIKNENAGPTPGDTVQ